MLAHHWLFVDSVFPVQFARWDPRYLFALFRSEHVISSLQSRLSTLNSHNFSIVSLQPSHKDGGVFVRFSYSSDENALHDITHSLEQHTKNNPLRSWTGLGSANIWLVKGSPWMEDMNRFPFPILKVAFDGPDLQEQSLYDLFRPYGRIKDITPPTPVPSGTLRSSTVTFDNLRAATVARNVVHGFTFHQDPTTPTRLRLSYQRPIQAHAVRDWMSSHPKIVVPIIAFLIGTLTYTIFDPVRSLMIEAKMLDWFDYREFKFYQWLRTNTVDRLSSVSVDSTNEDNQVHSVWKERKDAAAAIEDYLRDTPATIAFIHGPQGSGKTSMLNEVLTEVGRSTMIIDCRELCKATSDSQIVSILAAQTGYWPVFSFLNSLNSLIDLASVGLIGQKAGVSSSLSDQLRQILVAVTVALKGVTNKHISHSRRQQAAEQQEAARLIDEEHLRQRIRNGSWHDGRLDCVAGNGVMCELGVGDELFESDDSLEVYNEKYEGSDTTRRKSKNDVENVQALPIVIIRNFSAKLGGARREELLTVLAQWAADLAENQIAHVIVISDNREDSKRLSKAFPSRSLASIALSDADASSSMSFVKQKLHDAGVDVGFSSTETEQLQRLGGRASDLESLIHRVRSGQGVAEAVEDIIQRGVSELRKNAFGDDADDARGLPWARDQAWSVIRLLAKASEAPYYDVLLEQPFGGDETALRAMENAELITIITVDGRPSTVRPGKPVLRWVFQRLVDDPIFAATQNLLANEKHIARAEATVRSCEEELGQLVTVSTAEPRSWLGLGGRGACDQRAKFVMRKMGAAQRKLEGLQKKNLELKRVLADGG